MKKTLEWTHPALHLVQKALVAAVAIIAAVGLFALPVPAYAVSLGVPSHYKDAKLDPNTGKITITLDVKGDVDTSTSKSSAKLIVVLDTSGSMNEVVSHSGAVHYVADDNGQYGLVNGQYVQLTEHWTWTGYYYADQDGNVYTGQLYKQTTDVTRLDVAKQALSGLADQLISSSDSTVKMAFETFSDDGGDVSDWYGAGQAETFANDVNQKTAVGGTNWAGALAKANEKAEEDESTPTYIVFLSDGKPTYGMNGNTRYGDGTEGWRNMQKLDNFINDAVNTANNRPTSVLGFYAIYTGSDAASTMNEFASRTNASPNKAAIDGSDSTALNNAFKDIVHTINEGISYTNVTITDSISNDVAYVLPDGKDKPNFTYKKGGQIWDDAPTADVVNGQVVWNLGDTPLEKDVTYSVSFEVELTQAAYNAAAPADDVTPETDVETNSAASLAYSTVVNKNGTKTTTDQDPVAYNKPTVTVPTSTLHITKNWKGEGHKPDSLTVKVKQDGKDYKAVILTPDANGNWTKDVTVATGPKGHTYTIDEVEPEGWAKTANTTASEGVQFKNLFEETKSAGITNTYKAGILKLTKKIKGNAANTSDKFTFELSCADLKNKEFTSGDQTIKFDGDGKASVELTNDAPITLTNVPADKQISITETTTTPNANTTTTATVDGKEKPFTSSNTKTISVSVANGKATAVVYTNQVEIAPDTGLDISTTSQGVLLGVAAAGAATLSIAAIRKNHGERKER